MKRTIEHEQIRRWDEAFFEDRSNIFFQNTLLQNSMKECTRNHETEIQSLICFPHEIGTGCIQAQNHSERCWLFAALNFLRAKTIPEKNLPDSFTFSVNYLAFWDKLEKSNMFLDRVIQAGDDIFSKDWGKNLLRHPVQEGGQWFMFCSLIKKYGIVPGEIMPETYHSMESNELHRYLNRILRNDAHILLSDLAKGKDPEYLNKTKENMLADIYRILCCTLGTPPQRFTYEYYDKDGIYHSLPAMTPLQFCQAFTFQNPDDYVCIVDAPGRNRNYHQVYTVAHYGNMPEGQMPLYYNLDISEVKPLLVRQLKDGESIWFGCDCLNMMDRKKGIMSDRLYDSDKIFKLHYDMSKADLLDFGESSPNHDMVIAGFKELEDGSYCWKVENSWGEGSGQKGFYFMDDSYLEKYAFQFMIHKKHLSPKQLEELKTEPLILDFDDPLGA